MEDHADITAAITGLRNSVAVLQARVDKVTREQSDHLQRVHVVELRLERFGEAAVHEHSRLDTRVGDMLKAIERNHDLLSDHIRQEDEERRLLLSRTTGILVTVFLGFAAWVGLQIVMLAQARPLP